MISGLFEYTPAGKKKAPSRNPVLLWVHEAWRKIPEEKLAQPFQIYGISNVLDGTQGDELYAEEAQEIDDDEADSEFETEGEGESDEDSELTVD